MLTRINKTEFRDTMNSVKRGGETNFSYYALDAMYEYFEYQYAEEQVIDFVAVNMHWSEFNNWEEFSKEYQLGEELQELPEEEKFEELNRHTTVIRIPDRPDNGIDSSKGAFIINTQF